MSTTVTYKGETLTTVDNQTKVLETAGTWMEDDLTLTDTGGGGGDSPVWIRPADMPDLGALGKLTGQEVYFTYKTNDPPWSVAYFNCTCGSNKHFTVEEGQIVNGQFVANELTTLNNNAYFTKDLTGYSTPYTVFRITSDGSISDFQGFTGSNKYTEFGVSQINQEIVEIYMSTPNAGVSGNIRNGRFQGTRFIRSVTWFNCPISDFTRVFQNVTYLENVYIECTAPAVSLYFLFAGCTNLKYATIDAPAIKGAQNTFDSCTKLKYGNWEDWTVNDNTNISSLFSWCLSIESLDLSGWNATISAGSSTFGNCQRLRSVDISGLTFSAANVSNLFLNCKLLETFPKIKGSFTNLTSAFNSCTIAADEIDLSDIDMSNCTSLGTIISYCSCVKKITIPYVPTIPAQAFRDTPMCLEFHIDSATPPALANTNAFAYGGSDPAHKIYVPYSEDHSVLAAYQSATNWSSLASIIVEEPAP